MIGNMLLSRDGGNVDNLVMSFLALLCWIFLSRDLIIGDSKCDKYSS